VALARGRERPEILGVNPSTLNWRIGKLGLKADLKRARASRG